ncbi:ABC transporter permease [Peptostreptococcaceae bacterium AGR-M142]
MVKKVLKNTYTSLIYLFLYLPIVLLIIFSFNDSKYKGSWEGFTLKWYKELLRDSSIMDAVYYTFMIAIIGALVATVLGTITAIAIDSMSKKYKNIYMNTVYLPVMSPDIVIGISMLALFVGMKMRLGFLTLLISHITFNTPYVVLAVLPKLKQLDSNLAEAAMDLGATPLQAFFKVVLPEIMPGILTGALLSFTLSLDDFMVSFFTTGSGVNTLSIKIYSMTKRGITPKINALSTVMFLGVLVLLLILQRRDSKSLR